MSNRKSVVIPKGWRKLKPSECPRRGDKWKASYGGWYDQTKNSPLRADAFYSDIIHIRRIKRPSRQRRIAVAIGWFGVAGAKRGTMTHFVDSERRPICGARLHPKSEFQWCSDVVSPHYEKVECVGCNKIARTDVVVPVKRPSKPASVLDGVRTWKMFIPYENGCTSLPYHLATETKRVDQDRPLRLVPESDWRKIVKELRREK